MFAVKNTMADPVLRIAVSSNFAPTLSALIEDFQTQSPTINGRLLVSKASTGKHFAQIMKGAPFDLFFSADRLRAERLEVKGRIVPETRRTYAFGILALLTHNPHRFKPTVETLKKINYPYLAIANHRTAPYGRAAEETIKHLGLTQKLLGRVVKGDNVSQVFQFIRSGNAPLGFVSLAQLLAAGVDKESYWLVDETYYEPIEQQVVMLQDSLFARQFFNYLKSTRGREIIRKNGYHIPADL